MKHIHKIFSLVLITLIISTLPVFSQSLKVGANAPDFSLQLQQDGKPSDKTVTLTIVAIPTTIEKITEMIFAFIA